MDKKALFWLFVAASLLGLAACEGDPFAPSPSMLTQSAELFGATWTAEAVVRATEEVLTPTSTPVPCNVCQNRCEGTAEWQRIFRTRATVRAKLIHCWHACYRAESSQCLEWYYNYLIVGLEVGVFERAKEGCPLVSSCWAYCNQISSDWDSCAVDCYRKDPYCAPENFYPLLRSEEIGGSE